MLSAKVLATNEVVDVEGGDGLKCVKSKTRRSESQNLAKSQKLSQSGKSKSEKSKKLLKTRNLPNFDAIETGLNFLTPDAREAFNYLRLVFTKALILWHFDPKFYIQIKTDVSSYVIGDMLSQLFSETRPGRIVNKADLG